MRILAGSLRAKRFDQPKTTGTRPLSDKVRAAIFDVVGAPTDLQVLDAYAGSGAAGFEALSRGAARVEAIEADRTAARTIQNNAATLGLGFNYHLNKLKLEAWLAQPAQNPPAPRFDLIIVDPPYAKIDADLLARLTAYLTSGGVLVVSHATKAVLPDQLGPLHRARHKIYSDTSLSFYASGEVA